MYDMCQVCVCRQLPVSRSVADLRKVTPPAAAAAAAMATTAV